jgi:uncharacterized RDD family membrane protein YckC
MPGTRYDAHETERMRQLHGVELASFRRRAIAFLVDLLIGMALIVAVFLLFLLVYNDGRLTLRSSMGQPVADDGTLMLRLTFFKNWYSVIWWVLYFGLATYFGKGRTPGKRLMSIRVVSLVHERLGLWHSIERALGYAASALEFGFGFAQYFIHPNRRTVHDRIAETIVIAERRRARGEAALATSSAPPPAPPGP